MKKKLTVEIGYFRKRSKTKFYAFSIDDLCTLFNVSKRTMVRWIAKNLIDPTSLENIISVYNQLQRK